MAGSSFIFLSRHRRDHQSLRSGIRYCLSVDSKIYEALFVILLSVAAALVRGSADVYAGHSRSDSGAVALAS